MTSVVIRYRALTATTVHRILVRAGALQSLSGTPVFRQISQQQTVAQQERLVKFERICATIDLKDFTHACKKRMGSRYGQYNILFM